MAVALLYIRGLSKIYGPGCPGRDTAGCWLASSTDPASNYCSACRSIIACADINLELQAGEVLGIVGESGSGKSTVLQCLYLDLEPTSGSGYFRSLPDGEQSIWECDLPSRRKLQTYSMSMVYQSPHRGLNFLVTAGGNIAERLLAADCRHVGYIRDKAEDYLSRTEVPRHRMDDFPAFFSSGMQQRVQIAKALANNPPLVLLDEPTTGLDVSVQAGVLDLIRDIQQQFGISILVVSHDLSVIRVLADRTLVMRNGRVVESGLTDQILEDPQHPYTQLLVSSTL